jgi:2-polyprenyl-3-methyl-5-hydroxy-6-metoxy-1,4-benzoquinol methylase
MATIPSAAAAPVIGDAVLARYCSNYGIDADGGVTEEQVRFHLELERALTDELRASTPQTRRETFERCYDDLYSQLPWLASTGGPPDTTQWTAVLGPAPQRVHEVGSGSGGLARGLAALGYQVEATDITRERGGGRETVPNLTWTTTDGVHVEQFARCGPYDAVISDQVIEHLHPDDVVRHFSGCRAVLAPGGKLLFRTPHAFTGPHDVSRVFGFARPIGMHLREYTNAELRGHLRAAGFTDVRAVLPLPPLAAHGGPAAIPSRLYLAGLLLLEAAFSPLRPGRRRRLTALLPSPLRPRIFLLATVD